MHWLVPVVLTCLVGYILQPILNKKIADLKSRTRNLCWQYFFAAIFVNAVALIGAPGYLEDPRVIAIVAIGIFNAFACYCYWRAIAISLSKTSLFTQTDDLSGMILGYLILGEGRFIDFQLGTGIAFAIVAVFLFVIAKRRMEDVRGGAVNLQSDQKGIAIWIILYSFIWGGAIFSMRYFALGGMPLLNYVAGWYSGAFIGALIIFFLAGKTEAGQPLSMRSRLRILPLSLTICTSLMFGYWAKILAPIVVSQPIFQVAEMILPTAIGLWFFKEIKKLNLLSYIAIAVGLVGGIIIALSW